MKNLILISIFSLSLLTVKAQSKTTSSQDTTIYTRVDIQPEYPGGFVALANYVRTNIKSGSDKGIVFTTFVIELDGSVSNIKVLRSPSEAAAKEAARLVSNFPQFKPATKGGKVVRCSFTIPIRFPGGV